MLQDRSLFSLGSDVRFVSRSALTLLIVETYNDFVRFHGAPHSFPLCPIARALLTGLSAYQSALLTTPLVTLRILASLLQFAPFLRTFFTLCLVIPSCFMV